VVLLLHLDCLQLLDRHLPRTYGMW